MSDEAISPETGILRPAMNLPEELSPEYLTFNRVLPIAVDDQSVRVASSGQPAGHVIEDLTLLFGRPVTVIETSDEQLTEAIRRATSAAESAVALVRDMDQPDDADARDASIADARDLASQPPVVRFVNLLVREAAAAGASDIHLDATRDGLRVRFRIDGVLGDAPAPPRAYQSAVISRLKLIAELDIAEKRLPQDGRVKIRLDERELDLRIATVPSHGGESVTVRLLDHGGRPSGLADLGMSERLLQSMKALVRLRHGIVLVTGPTGSGKTTTLYAALSMRDQRTEKILTVEDPVEYELPGVTQIPVHDRIGMTFARALRSMVRHDPDVLMIGEMRDEETADIAVRAAMTGHLVFSTLHTNDALGAIPRLLDLGVPAHLLAATVEGILAQRLVRLVCERCRALDPECAACRRSGYRGRTGVFELLLFDDRIKQAVSRGANRTELERAAAAQGMVTLRHYADALVAAGRTTAEEVLRVVQ